MIRAAASDVRGVLYVHDDLMVTGALLDRLGGAEWVCPCAIAPREGYVHRNGSVVIERWKGLWWWRRRNLFPILARVAADPRMEPYWRADGDGVEQLAIAQCKSDMLYASLAEPEHTTAFLTLLDVFAHHTLFLEAAIPHCFPLDQTAVRDRAALRKAVRLSRLAGADSWGKPP